MIRASVSQRSHFERSSPAAGSGTDRWCALASTRLSSSCRLGSRRHRAVASRSVAQSSMRSPISSVPSSPRQRISARWARGRAGGTDRVHSRAPSWDSRDTRRQARRRRVDGCAVCAGSIRAYDADAVTSIPMRSGGIAALPGVRRPRCRGAVSNQQSRERLASGRNRRRRTPLPAVARAASDWGPPGNVMLVAGANVPGGAGAHSCRGSGDSLARSGGRYARREVAAVLRAGLDAHGTGLVINASRSVLFASRGADFASAARSVVEGMKAQIAAQIAALRGRAAPRAQAEVMNYR